MLWVLTGTRPDILKLAPILWELQSRNIPHLWVHSGQHYDECMSRIFFTEVVGRRPDFSLDKAPHNSPGDKIEHIKTGLSALMSKCSVMLVQGDTLTALAGALWANDAQVPIAHVEAGLRSGDIRTPEELIRITVDNLSHSLFAPTSQAYLAVGGEKQIRGHAYRVGNTLVDTLNRVRDNGLIPPSMERDEYVLLTVHRTENLSNSGALERIFRQVSRLLWYGKKVIFPVHPHTQDILDMLSIQYRAAVTILPPQGYLSFLSLLKSAALVMTDSGSVQEEAYLLGVPCVVLRPTTERIETIEGRAAILVDPALTDDKKMEHLILNAFGLKRTWSRDAYGTGGASVRIVDIVRETYGI